MFTRISSSHVEIVRASLLTQHDPRRRRCSWHSYASSADDSRLGCEGGAMTRGNAREIARAKNQKKQAEMNKGKNHSGMSLAKRREQDAAAMQAKQAVGGEKISG